MYLVQSPSVSLSLSLLEECASLSTRFRGCSGVDILFIVAPIVFGPCFVVQCLVSFLVLHHLAGEEGGLLYLFFLVSCVRYVMCLLLTVPLAGRYCVLVAFPGHTHLLFDPTTPSSQLLRYAIYRHGIFLEDQHATSVVG